MQTYNYKYLFPWDHTNDNSNTPSTQVVTCFLQKDNKILALQRAKKDAQHKLWGIPGGKLNREENPLLGLSREIEEETGCKLDPASFELLGKAISITPSDGEYGLYLYHAILPSTINVKLNSTEHYSFLWTTLEEFESLQLLTAQREAYLFVKAKLKEIMDKRK